MRITEFDDGLIINGDSTSKEVYERVSGYTSSVQFIMTDPPYGNIVKDAWDKTKLTDDEFAQWMIDWTVMWSGILDDNAAFYVWGGIGLPDFRPFLKYIARIEDETELKMANLITWSKRRAYGIQYNYLFTREECAYLFKGEDIKKPRMFNVPLLSEKRGYAGYNKKYPAKSEFKRRTNVWTDITEMFRNKRHSTQKAQKLYEVAIETHTAPGETVLDVFGGAGTCALAARKLGRKFIVVEKDEKMYDNLISILNHEK